VSFRLTLILACFADLGFSAYSKENFTNIFEDHLLVIDPTKSPTLKYYCLKESFFIDSLFYTEPTDQPMDFIAKISLDSHSSFESSNLFPSTISSLSISDWLIGQYLDSIEFNIPLSTFLMGQSDKILQFHETDKEKRYHQLVLITQELRDRNHTEHTTISAPNKKLEVNSKKDEEGLGKFALYIIIAGGICSIYSVMAPSGTAKQGNTKAEKIEMARRKKWLEQIRQKGWIDRTTYHFLLKKIDDLPAWLGRINPPDQSAETAEGNETSVDLSKRKSGESVVKTKDTSEDNTSR
jgi:hypothetical protein